MAKRKTVEIFVKLKDGVSGTLSKIGGSLKTLGTGFKNFAKIGVAATTAIVAALGGLAKAYAEQESVNKRLKDTFDAAGESGAKAVAKWSAWATAIQRVTTLGDEEIMNLISLAKTMGIANKRIAEATKGAIGLSKAFGIDLNSSMKMVALAFQGEYEMLQRYIPQLRQATTEAEKMAIVQDAMARGFKVAEGELDSIAGQFKALKGVIGDALQEIGRVLFGDGGLARGLELVKEKLIELTEGGAITKWAEQAKSALDAVIQTIRILASGGSDARGRVLQAIGNVLKAAFLDAATLAGNLLKIAAPKIGELMAKGFKAAAEPEWVKRKGDRAVAEARIAKRTGDAGFEKALPFTKAAARNEQKILDEMKKIQAEREGKMEESVNAAIDNSGSRTEKALEDAQRVLDDIDKSLNESVKRDPLKSGKAKGFFDKLGRSIAIGAEKGTREGVKDGVESATSSPTSGFGSKEGLSMEDSSGFLDFMTRGGKGVSKQAALGKISELVQGGFGGNLGDLEAITEELMRGQDGVGLDEALKGAASIMSSGAYTGDPKDTIELIKSMARGQDQFNKKDIPGLITGAFGGSPDAMGGASITDPTGKEKTPAEQSLEYLKEIAQNTKGGLF